MTALTRDRATSYREGLELEYPVAAATKIYAGSLVCVNTGGYAVPAADTNGFLLAGAALEQVDNSTGANADKTVRVRRRGVFQFAAASISQAMVGKAMFVKDDQTFDDTSTHLIYAGRLVKFDSATGGWLDINCPVAAGVTVQPFTITLPRFTGWTKDGTDQTTPLPLLELPVGLRVKRAYVNLGTAPGADKTLAVKLNDVAVVTISGTATQGESESLDLAVGDNTDWVVKVNETAAGAAANCDLMLVAVQG